MDFYDVLNQVIALLQREGRVTYGALKRQFSLDDEFLEDIEAEASLMAAMKLSLLQPARCS